MPMSTLHTAIHNESDDEAADRQTASLGGFAIILLLLVVSLFLVRELQAQATANWGMQADAQIRAIAPYFDAGESG
jgi:ABC-type phosphate transport system permease subunit